MQKQHLNLELKLSSLDLQLRIYKASFLHKLSRSLIVSQVSQQKLFMLDIRDPHLLTGKARIQEIGKILAIGILRMQARKQNQIKLTDSLSSKRDSKEKVISYDPCNSSIIPKNIA